MPGMKQITDSGYKLIAQACGEATGERRIIVNGRIYGYSFIDNEWHFEAITVDKDDVTVTHYRDPIWVEPSISIDELQKSEPSRL